MASQLDVWQLFLGKKVVIITKNALRFVGKLEVVGKDAVLVRKKERYTLVTKNAIDAIYTLPDKLEVE